MVDEKILTSVIFELVGFNIKDGHLLIFLQDFISISSRVRFFTSNLKVESDDNTLQYKSLLFLFIMFVSTQLLKGIEKLVHCLICFVYNTSYILTMTSRIPSMTKNTENLIFKIICSLR